MDGKQYKSRTSGFRINGIAGLLACALMTMVPSAVWAGGYTDKSYHEGDHTYKHPNQRSFTGPFDYGNKEIPAPARPQPTGKCNCFNFDSTKSYDVDRQKLTIHWDFGDGQVSEAPVVQHCYEKAGDYTVNLTVKDSSGMVCDSGMATTKVTSNFPPTAVPGQDASACVGENVSFDGSGSTASGSAATYKWNFGDGQMGEGERASHTYEKSGNYRVVLTVDDGKNTECSVAQGSLNARISDRVSVDLKGRDSACVGQNNQFNAASIGGASKLSWNFGDGTTWEGGSSASHAYQKSGSYTVRVTADNGKGEGCSVATATHTIKINAAPIANAGENLACCVGQETRFDGSKSSQPDGLPLTYHWDFGDGGTGEGAEVTHAYEKSGNYRVVLTVKDNSGSDCDSASSSFVANVNTKPEAVIEVR